MDNKNTYISGMEWKNSNTDGAIVLDVSLSTRKVKGRFASFDTLDSDGDIFVKGTFKKSIKENGPEAKRPRIAYLYQHDVWQPVGKLTALYETDKGLDFEADIPNTTLGTDVLKMYEAGILREHSVGIRPIKWRVDEDKGIRYITENKLWEGSVVTWGANENTPFLGFKSMTKEQAQDMIDRFAKAIRNGTFTDETFNLLEIALEQVKCALDQPQGSTGKPEADLISAFAENLKI